MEPCDMPEKGFNVWFVRFLIAGAILLILYGISHAFEPDGNSYSRKEHEERHRTLKRGHPIRVQQPILVDRHVLSKADYEADPSILISKPAERPVVQVVEKIVYVERKPIVATISAEWGE